MPAFHKLNWGDLDVFAILVGGGVATLEPSYAQRSLNWLRARRYMIKTVDFDQGISPVVARLAEELHWKKQFGYELSPTDRNLDCLSDAFWFDITAEEGLVFELRNFELALSEDREWSEGLLRIISEHTLRHLALGHRSFAVVHVTNGDSPIVGVSLGERSVPYPYDLVRGSVA